MTVAYNFVIKSEQCFTLLIYTSGQFLLMNMLVAVFFCKRNVRNPTTVRVRLQVEQFKNAVNKPETVRHESSVEAACVKTQFVNE